MKYAEVVRLSLKFLNIKNYIRGHFTLIFFKQFTQKHFVIGCTF